MKTSSSRPVPNSLSTSVSAAKRNLNPTPPAKVGLSSRSGLQLTRMTGVGRSPSSNPFRSDVREHHVYNPSKRRRCGKIQQVPPSRGRSPSYVEAGSTPTFNPTFADVKMLCPKQSSFFLVPVSAGRGTKSG